MTTTKENDPRVQDRVKRNLNRIQGLPALSDVVAKIISLADSPTVSGQQVAEIVGRDQSMVTSILKIVNSPFYGLNRRVSSINHAIVLLGYRTIRNIALSTTLVNSFAGPACDRRFDRGRFWTHSVCTASAAKLLAARFPDADAEEAFLAGLIHDMGQIVFDHYFSREFSVALDYQEAKKCSLVEAEKAIFGLDHAEVGTLVARKWNFPPLVAEAIATHHRAKDALAASNLAACVYLANELARISELRLAETPSSDPKDGTSCFDRIDVDVRTHLRLTPEGLDALLADFEGEMEKARTFLSALNV